MAKERKGSNQGRRDRFTAENLPFDALRRALAWIIDEKIFSQLTFHGNTTWAASQLAVLAVLWVWSDKGTLTGAFEHAKHLAMSMLGQVALTTYQGLTKALVTWTGPLLPLIQGRLHNLMEKNRWRPLADRRLAALGGGRFADHYPADSKQ